MSKICGKSPTKVPTMRSKWNSPTKHGNAITCASPSSPPGFSTSWSRGLYTPPPVYRPGTTGCPQLPLPPYVQYPENVHGHTAHLPTPSVSGCILPIPGHSNSSSRRQGILKPEGLLNGIVPERLANTLPRRYSFSDSRFGELPSKFTFPPAPPSSVANSEFGNSVKFLSGDGSFGSSQGYGSYLQQADSPFWMLGNPALTSREWPHYDSKHGIDHTKTQQSVPGDNIPSRPCGSPKSLVSLHFPSPKPARSHRWDLTSTPKAAHTNRHPRVSIHFDQPIDLSQASADNSLFRQNQIEPLDLSIKGSEPRPSSKKSASESTDEGISEESFTKSSEQKTTKEISEVQFMDGEDHFDEQLSSDITCPYCFLVFHTSLAAYEMHVYRHTRARPYYCYRCKDATFPAYFYLRKHQRLPHSLHGFRDFETYNCAVCQLAMQTVDEFDLHLNFCGVPSPKPKSKKRRKKSKRKSTSNEKSKEKNPVKSRKPSVSATDGESTRDGFFCDLCSRKFNSNNALARHMGQEHHGGREGFPCPDCNKGFSSQYNLAIHRRIHTGVKPYTCPDCGQKFRVKCTMQAHHSRVHKPAAAEDETAGLLAAPLCGAMDEDDDNDASKDT